MNTKLNYEPNRTPEQLDAQRMLKNLQLMHQQRFEKMMRLIKISFMLTKVKVKHQ